MGRLFLFYIYGFIVAAFQVTGDNAASIQVSETEKNGTVLFNATGYTNCMLQSLSPTQTDDYVAFNETNSLTILKPLDLEVLSLEDKSSTLTVNYKCDNTQLSISLNIIPVNEFVPVFLNQPYSCNITEGSATGTEVFNLGDKWSDDDKVKYGNATAFRLHPYIIIALDGRQHFKLNETTGSLTTTTVFDYEEPTSRHYFRLNVSVEDEGGRAAYATVDVNIQDIDDNPPIFTLCDVLTDRCHVTEYTAIIDRFFQGTLTTISPGHIRAKDMDTGINANLEYTIDNVNDETATYIEINNHTGAVEVLVPFMNFTNWTDTEMFNISLQVKATEESTNAYHTNVSFIILVYRDFPTTTTTTTTITSPYIAANTTPANTNDQASKIDPILIIEIIVPVCAVVVIVIIVVCVIKNRKKNQRDTRYKLRESQKLENLHKSESFNLENIDVISSTPINPYELISMYARMDSKENNKEGSPKSSNNGKVTNVSEDTRRDDVIENTAIAPSKNVEGTRDDIYENDTINSSPEVETDGNLYTKVDKRKPKKRQNVLAFMNDSMETTEQTHFNINKEGDKENSDESPDQMNSTTDNYSPYDNVDMF